MYKIFVSVTASAMLLTAPNVVPAQSNACTVNELAGVYESQYGNMDCKASGSSLDCCYSGNCRYDLNLTLTGGGDQLIGKWDHKTGRSGTAQFDVTEDCRIGDGRWGVGTAEPTTTWTVGEKLQDYSVAAASADACAAMSDCGPGFYCAFDRTCHPDSHLPLQDLQIELSGGSAPYELTPVVQGEPAEEPEQRTSALPGGPIPFGAPTLSGVAGKTGDVQYIGDLGDGFLNGFYWTQPGGNPCSFMITGWRLSQDPSVEGREELRDMHATGCAASASALQGSDHHVALDRPLESAIGRIEVCNAANDSQRMTGIRAWGSWITDAGTMLYINNEKSHSVGGCDEWSSSMLCGSNKVATGVVVYANERVIGETGTGSITGIQLICRQLGVR